MGKVKRIVVHCTGEPADAVRNREYYRHLFFDLYNWKHWGYHVLVYQNGVWEILQPLPRYTSAGGFITDATMANGVRGYNGNSLHIAYVGGLNPHSYRPADTRTREQRATLLHFISMWKIQYGVSEVVGHSQLVNNQKACPCFDARKEYENA